MGEPMGGRLIDAGYALKVYDNREQAASSLSGRGERLASVGTGGQRGGDDFPEPADTADRGTGVPGCRRPDRRRQGQAGGRPVDHRPHGGRPVAQALAARGILYVDCPVSGGVTGAAKGTLAVMVACPRAVFDELQPALSVFGKPFFLASARARRRPSRSPTTRCRPPPWRSPRRRS